jgi:hypothetical protein
MNPSIGGDFNKAILVYDVGQSTVWWYCIISGLSRPLHANWPNLLQWITPFSYLFIMLQRNKDEKVCSALLSILFAAASYIASLVYAFQRLKIDLGAGSYIPLDPFPELPASTTSTCRDLLHNPASLLYSDPNWLPGRRTQIFVAIASIFVLFMWFMGIVATIGCLVQRVTSWATGIHGICIQLIVLIWLAVIAKRGVPLMLHEGCGVVVIAMSPAHGYYDSELHYDGLRLQAAREAFGICRSLFSNRLSVPG